MNPFKWKLIDDYKTHIGVVALSLIAVLLQFEVITPEVAGWLATAAGTWTGVSLRLAVKKTEPK